jgi:hypothetical protein
MEDIFGKKQLYQTLILAQKNKNVHAITLENADGSTVMVYGNPSKKEYKVETSTQNTVVLSEKLKDFLCATSNFHSYILLYQDYRSQKNIEGIAFKQGLLNELYSAEEELIPTFEQLIKECVQTAKK